MTRPRFLLNEHVWGGLVEVARRLDADVVLAQSQLPEGTADEDVLALAAEQGRVLLTSNAQDFAPLAAEWFLAGRDHWGISSSVSRRVGAPARLPGAVRADAGRIEPVPGSGVACSQYPYPLAPR